MLALPHDAESLRALGLLPHALVATCLQIDRRELALQARKTKRPDRSRHGPCLPLLSESRSVTLDKRFDLQVVPCGQQSAGGPAIERVVSAGQVFSDGRQNA